MRIMTNRGSLQDFTKVIVFCIDRDDDIGIKGGLETPIIGKELCINAGTRLAIEDPEDSDCNAIFGAIKSYEEFKMKGYDVEIALVAGKYNRGIEGDLKITQEIDKSFKCIRSRRGCSNIRWRRR